MSKMNRFFYEFYTLLFMQSKLTWRILWVHCNIVVQVRIRVCCSVWAWMSIVDSIVKCRLRVLKWFNLIVQIILNMWLSLMTHICVEVRIEVIDDHHTIFHCTSCVFDCVSRDFRRFFEFGELKRMLRWRRQRNFIKLGIILKAENDAIYNSYDDSH